MAEQGDTPDLSQNPKDREVLEEIARLINERGTDAAGLVSGETAAALGEEAVSRHDERDAVDGPESSRLDFAACLLDAFPAGVALCADDRILCANNAFALAFGYRSGREIIDAGGLRLLFPRARAGAAGFAPPKGQERQILRAATRSGRHVDMPISRESFEFGTRSYWLLVLRPEFGDRIESAAASAARPVLDALAGARGQALVRLDGDTRIRAANGRAATLFGKSEALLRGSAFEDVFATGDRDRLGQACARLLASPVSAAEEIELRLGDGNEHTGAVSVALVATPDDAANPLCALLESAPGTAETADGDPPLASLVLGVSPSNLEILAKISHEIRTPLNSIIGFAEFMKEERLGPIGNVKYSGYIDDIHQSGRHALSLINDLLDLSKIESGNFEPNFTAVDANEVMAESVKLLQPQAQRNRVVVRLALAPALPPVLADRRSLTQIALNLLSNAVKFTESGGQVIASTAREADGSVKISVHDTGVGMTPAEIEQAMTPFRQLDTAPRKQDGTGLGLPLTKALVEANHASMHVESRPGSGTRVDVSFPPSRVAG